MKRSFKIIEKHRTVADFMSNFVMNFFKIFLANEISFEFFRKLPLLGKCKDTVDLFAKINYFLASNFFLFFDIIKKFFPFGRFSCYRILFDFSIKFCVRANFFRFWKALKGRNGVQLRKYCNLNGKKTRVFPVFTILHTTFGFGLAFFF